MQRLIVPEMCTPTADLPDERSTSLSTRQGYRWDLENAYAAAGSLFSAFWEVTSTVT